MSFEAYTFPRWRMPIGRGGEEKAYINRLVEDSEIQEGFRVQLLAQALVTRSKDHARKGLHKMIEDQALDSFFSSQISVYLSDQGLNLIPSLPDPSAFSIHSWSIQLDFILYKPYLSKDDREFYILDNPVRKEWVFQVPYIAPSQWKGALRAAMVQELKHWWQRLSNGDRAAKSKEFAERRFRMTLLFGDEKGEEPGSLKGLAKYLDKLGEEGAANLYREKVKKFFKVEADSLLPHHQGWLHFYPTYFDRIGLEVINPHSRETGAGERPIYFECVPAGSEGDPTRGTFVLLYVPLGEISDEDMQADFQAVAQGLKAMFTVYGFGAKTSSGFGRANVQWESAEIHPEDPEHNLKKVWESVWSDDEQLEED